MYFNTKYEHSGVLFQGRFKSNHVDSDAYFRHIFSYVHLNPVELTEKNWKEAGVRNKKHVTDFLDRYLYLSFLDYHKDMRPERAILSYDDAPDFLKQIGSLDEMIKDLDDYKDVEIPRTYLGKK